ncbi:MAG: DUF3276 family protein [Paludibacteraceae bacterium]|nr:DUF3276 family protein [Paludibacteraceae bacterium]
MEDYKPKVRIENREQEIIFSKSIKAGKRIYYLDVKRNRKDDLFVAITESKKIVSGFDEDVQVSYEKHKIFLYKEDFDKFVDGLQEVIDFIKTKGSAFIAEESEKKEENDSLEENFSAISSEPITFPLEFNMEEFEK